ncbi:hypothetical protein H0H93_002084, partial [Arthromyces matolae]
MARKRKITPEEKAARIQQIQQWEADFRSKNNSNWERYQEGIERARKEAYDKGKDLDDAALNYSWRKFLLSLRMHQLKKKKGNLRGPGRPRSEINPAEIASWEAEKKGQRGWKMYSNALEKAEARAIEDGKNAEEVKA